VAFDNITPNPDNKVHIELHKQSRKLERVQVPDKHNSANIIFNTLPNLYPEPSLFVTSSLYCKPINKVLFSPFFSFYSVRQHSHVHRSFCIRRFNHSQRRRMRIAYIVTNQSTPTNNYSNHGFHLLACCLLYNFIPRTL
jgi:hypothetical protein